MIRRAAHRLFARRPPHTVNPGYVSYPLGITHIGPDYGGAM